MEIVYSSEDWPMLLSGMLDFDDKSVRLKELKFRVHMYVYIRLTTTTRHIK